MREYRRAIQVSDSSTLEALTAYNLNYVELSFLTHWVTTPGGDGSFYLLAGSTVGWPVQTDYEVTILPDGPSGTRKLSNVRTPVWGATFGFGIGQHVGRGWYIESRVDYGLMSLYTDVDIRHLDVRLVIGYSYGR